MNVKNVSRSYDSGKHYSIKNISFGIKKQECLGLIGEHPSLSSFHIVKFENMIFLLITICVSTKVQMEQAKAQFSRFSHDERKCSREQWNVTGTSESHFVPKRIFSIQT